MKEPIKERITRTVFEEVETIGAKALTSTKKKLKYSKNRKKGHFH